MRDSVENQKEDGEMGFASSPDEKISEREGTQNRQAP
jgi:hypothetical protein